MTSLKIMSALAASFLLVASAAANATENSSSTAPPQGWSTPNFKTADSTTTQKPATAAAKPRTAASIECSKEADAKNLHGKERKAFRASCKSAIKAGKPVPDKT
jgi:hypothetical protein